MYHKYLSYNNISMIINVSTYIYAPLGLRLCARDIVYQPIKSH